MSLPQRRVTQKDVAQAAGVDRATVSLALRKHPGIPEKTRQRIEKFAAKLGYVPDPMLAALASYRNSNRPEGYRGTLAWFADTAPDYRWQDVPHFVAYLQAAERAAQRMGYQLEVFDVSKMGVSWERAATIAQARGIRGILVCPQPHADTHLETFPWHLFSAVTFGYSLTKPNLHSVSASHYRAVRRIVQELYQRGYQRIGLAVRPEHDRRIDYNQMSGYFMAGHLHPSLTLLAPCPDDGTHDGPHLANETYGMRLKAWLQRHKPEALITGTSAALALIQSWGYDIPRDLGVVCGGLAVGKNESRTASRKGHAIALSISGVVEDNERIGEVAVDLLIAMINRGERGVPQKPQRVLVEGTWHEGNTLRPVSVPSR
jgi:LacI family transcriptional regulator/LacI family repressor for deo operon, udp, cdd, tsx, nupC, and nupG